MNPFREPGLERYWIPSIASSALNGTVLADHWFEVHTGGDLAFLLGVLLALVERGGVDTAFVDARTTGFAEACAQAAAVGWDRIAGDSGMSRERIVEFADLLIARPNTVFVWSMGLTQHAHGVDTVKALVNVGLARGLAGPAPSRAGAHSRSLGCAGRGGGGLCPAPGRRDARTNGSRLAFPGAGGARGGRRAR